MTPQNKRQATHTESCHHTTHGEKPNMVDKTAIAERNDKFRVNVINSPSSTKGKCVLTASIAAQNPLEIAHILHVVKNFDDFNEDNDPYKEHDFGKITISGVDMFWKIDYFKDENLTEGTDDPLTSYQVMTIMLASEY